MEKINIPFKGRTVLQLMVKTYHTNIPQNKCKSFFNSLRYNFFFSFEQLNLFMLIILYLFVSLTGVWGSQVVVPQRINAVLGKNVTLECRVEVGPNLTLTQSSWERRLPSGSATVAVYNPEYGISIPPEFIHRLYFRSPSSHDATIILENVGFSDVGLYTCKVATFPLGNTQATTTVNVLGTNVWV